MSKTALWTDAVKPPRPLAAIAELLKGLVG